MKLKNLKIKGLKLIKSKIYRDKRGFLREIYKNKLLNQSFLFDVMSYSKKNVLRGLHIQTQKAQAKIITVTNGKILDVVVDLRKNSKTFGKHFKIELTEKNGKSIFIPAGFAHGFLARAKENIVHYYNTNYRSQGHEIGIMWNDPLLKIKWPIKKPILSQKDKKNLTFKQFQKK